MKNRNFIKSSIGLLLPAVMALGVLFGVQKRASEADAYDKTGSLTTTIDLNDTSAADIKSYYSSLNGLSSAQLQGQNLLKNLKPILKNNQKYYKYDNDSLWALYEITDRDWVKSPASAIPSGYGTYNANTNTITGYKYGANTSSNKGSNPYIHALYVDRSVDNQTRAWDDHQQTQWGINQEHIWPKSQGFNAGGAGGARGDPMHLWAGNGRVNGTEHNNNMYGFVDLSKSYTNPYEVKGFKNLKDNYSGKSLTVKTSTDTVFEPQDSDKGDIARAIFYMVARYNNIAGNDTITTDNPNLALKQTTQSLTSYTTTSSNNATGYMGLMTDLLYWNHLDPVDEYEIHRNNLLFNNYTNNRNPFIDYPEWADYIWGKPVYEGRNYVSYSNTPTGYVDLNTDVINGFKGETPTGVTVKSLELVSKPTKLVYTVGETLNTSGMVVKAHMSDNTTKTLTSSDYTITPSGALKTSDNEVTITYENKSVSFAIAVKSNGSSGETQVLNFNFTSCPAGWPSGSASATTASTQTYTVNDVAYSFSLGANVYYNTSQYLMIKSNSYLGLPAIDGYKLTKIVAKNSSGCSTSVNVGVSSSSSEESYITGGSPQIFSTQSGTYTYNLSNTEDNNKYYLLIKSTNLQLTSLQLTYDPVSSGSDVDVESISLNKNALSLETGTSETLTATVLPNDATIKLVSWTSSNSSIAEVSQDGEVLAKAPGNAVITCTSLDDETITATCNVSVQAPVTLQSISLSGEYATEFYVGEAFSTEGMTVTANYSDGSHIDVTDDIEVSGYDTETIGEQTVTVSYGDVSTTYSIEVKEKGLAENEILFIPSDYGLVNADDLDSYTNSIATLSYYKNTGTQPKFYSSSSSFRVYAKNTMTISGTKNITKIELEITTSTGDIVISTDVGTFANNIWSGETNMVTFTFDGTSGQRNIVSIKVTYDLSSEDIVNLLSISLSGSQRTEFFRNETFTYEGLIVTAHYSNGTSGVVTPTSVSTPTMSSTGTKTVIVSYTENNITVDASYQITVSNPVGISITLTGNYKTEFTKGDSFSTSGMTVVEHFNDGSVANHLPSSCTFTGYDMDQVGTQTVTVTYNHNQLSTTYDIVVNSDGSTQTTYTLTISPGDFLTDSYKVNNGDHEFMAYNVKNSDDFMKVHITTNQIYQTGGAMQWQKSAGYLYNTTDLGEISSVVVGTTEGSFSTYYGTTEHPASTTGSTTVSGGFFTIETGADSLGKTNSVVVTFTITTKPSSVTLQSIALSGDYKTSFDYAEAFDSSGLVCTVTYSDKSTEIVTPTSITGYDGNTPGVQTITVSYTERLKTVTATYNVTVAEANIHSYKLASGALLEGDYIFYYNNFAMKGEIASNRLTNKKFDEFSGIVDSISEYDGSIIWHVEKSGEHYTIRNKATGKYVAGNGTKNQATLLDTVTDSAKWTVIQNNGTYDFINFGNTNKSVNANLRNNGASGWACYASDYSSPFSLYKLENTEFVKTNRIEDISNGDVITFGSTKNSVNYYIDASDSFVEASHLLKATANLAETDGRYLVSNSELFTFEVVEVGSYYALRSKLGYLTYHTNSPHITFADNYDSDLSLFEFEDDNGKLYIHVKGDDNRYIRMLDTTASNPRFGIYTKSTGEDVTIYQTRTSGEAEAWSQEFLSSTYGCVTTDWNSFASSYGLLTNESKAMLKSAIADQSASANSVSQAAARYDYIVADPRYEVSNFISERGVVTANTVSLLNMSKIDSSIIVIIALAAVGATSLGGYFVYKRRKEQN